MNAFALAQALDALATASPERHGYGYSDTQHPWRHDPAIEQGRQVVLEFLGEVRQRGLGGTFVQIGLGRRGGMHRALRLLARRVVSVERDAAVVAAFAAAGDLGDGDVLVTGDSHAALVQRQVAAAANGCDLLLLDGDDSYAGMRADFEAYAPLVRVGGLVAIGDRSQAFPDDHRPYDVDRFVHDLQRDWLLPRGVRARRLGGAHAIHCYLQTAATAGAVALPWPQGRGTVVPAPDLGQHAGCSVHELGGRCFAVAPPVPELRRRAILRNEPQLLLTAATRSDVAALAEAFAAAQPVLQQALALLPLGQPGAARQLVADLERDFPGLRAALLPSLEAAPHNRELLLAVGTLSLLGGRPREGAALLRRALEQAWLDKNLLLALARACTDVLGDEAAARELLDAARRQVRKRQVAAICHERLSGNVLWHYPQLLADVRGVLQVGAHTGEEVEAFQLLGIEHQAYLEPQPQAFAALQARCRELGVRSPVLLPFAAGSTCGERDLRCAFRSERASFLATHELARLPADERQLTTHRVPVRTLDSLVDDGTIDPQRCDLLLVDTEGSELEVLQGARQLLAHVDLVCVAVCLEPIYAGAPLPQEIQGFLRELGDDAFALRAFEPGPDPARGDAVFRRIEGRR